MTRKHWTIGGVVTAGLLVVAFGWMRRPSEASASSGDSSAPRVSYALAHRAPINDRFSVAGEFVPFQEVQLHAKVAGYIRKINVDIGDRVRSGQVLAELEVPELAAQVQGSEASVRHRQEEITRAQHELARTEAEHQSLHAAADRLKQASAARPGLIAAQELEDAEARDRASEAQVEAAKSSLSAAKEQLDVSKADHLHYAALSDYARITAPFSGVVTWRYADTGALVQSGTSSASSQPVVKLAQVDVLRLRVPVPESAAKFIHAGSTATIHVQATGEQLQGKVTRLADAFDPTTRTMQVEIDVPNKDGSLQPGMYADVSLETENRPNALQIPVQALITDGNRSKVMIVGSDNHIGEREVKTGIQSASDVEIVSGLREGDRVVVGNPRSYRDGQTVVPVLSTVSTDVKGGI